MTLIPWQANKPVVWDVTVICTTANSCRGTAAEIAATRKEAKYSNLSSQYTFHPIAIETHGPLNETALDILCELGRRITACSGDDGGFFLFQRLSVCMQRF